MQRPHGREGNARQRGSIHSRPTRGGGRQHVTVTRSGAAQFKDRNSSSSLFRSGRNTSNRGWVRSLGSSNHGNNDAEELWSNTGIDGRSSRSQGRVFTSSSIQHQRNTQRFSAKNSNGAQLANESASRVSLGRRSDHNRGHNSDRGSWPMTLRRLQDIERNRTPEEMAIFLASSGSGLERCLNGDLNSSMFYILLNIFGKISETTGTTQLLTRILQLILESNFLTKIKVYFITEKGKRDPKVATALDSTLKLLNALITVIPNNSREEVTVMMYLLGTVIKSGDVVTDEILEYQSQVNANLETLNEKKMKKANGSRKSCHVEDDLHALPPPDEFRDIPVFPRMIDINGEAGPFIRTNLIDRAYHDTEHYLDVQFRLLREDFVRPLREGIAEFKAFCKARKHGGRQKRLENVKVYDDVQVQFMQPGGQNGILHRIQFNVGKLSGVRWNNTKRLMHGNLLCLSSDGFKEEALFAVVMDSSPNDLVKGILSVLFVTQENDDDMKEISDEDEAGSVTEVDELTDDVPKSSQAPVIDMKKMYVMVETDAYFEAYRHVLSGLQETTKIPLERYIVRYKSNLHAPSYMRPSVTGGHLKYDFSPITKKVSKVEILGDEWPSPEQMNLDPSQTEAVKIALTKELAIIQGPPGTGKTHVGLIIMRLLLQNKFIWANPTYRGKKKRQSPILVVCYTNHALDQFLEGIAKFAGKDHKIVRVGGRIKSEEMKRFSLRELRFQRRKSGLNATVRRAAGELDWELKEIEKGWNINIRKLEASLRCIPHFKALQPFIWSHHYKYFEMEGRKRGVNNRNRQKIQNQVLLSWLGIGSQLNGADEQHVAANSNYFFSRTQADQDVQPYFLQYDTSDELIEAETKAVLDHRMLDTEEIPGERTKAKSEKELSLLVKEMGAVTLSDVVKTLDGTEEYRGSDVEGTESDIGGEWEQQPHERRRHQRQMKSLIHGNETMTDDEERQVPNVESLALNDRWRLYRTWLKRWREDCRSGIDEEIRKYNLLARQLKEVRRQEEAEILREADVVAVTTTGAAKYRDIIYNLDSKIVIIEEAAEVLEAHIITSMPKSTNHLILIGDHRQLKPSPTVYELARNYNLDTSLFERLIKIIPHVTLSRQHRMRPEIADLIRPHIYKNLEDHESVSNRQEIIGVAKTVFFVSHTEKEDSVVDGKSKKNQHEADFIVALCKHIILQGYKPEQITILTMYTGQLFAFGKAARNKVPAVPDGVKVTAVDNFQGEENDIILLSLVRSNEEAKIGFLAVENRICVALSRAKYALYCIGNMNMLSSKNKTWRTIVDHLRKSEMVGDALLLQCKNHPDRTTFVKCKKDFDDVPEGGCGQPCKARLDCGHVCPKPCHPYDHSKYRCTKPCEKVVPCEQNHRCKRKCFQSCQPCTTRVPKVIPKCGHIQYVLCESSPADFKCLENVEANLACGHTVSIPCHQAETARLSMCKEKCRELLECGHSCKGSCYDCFQGRLHVPCAKKCGRILVCGHSCSASCKACPPCGKRCRTRCKHSDCKRVCGQPCVLCREKCEWKCPHFECSKLCSEPCDRPPCNEPCMKKLECKHACIGLCGEPCPTLCRICNKKQVEEIFFGDEDFEDARFVQLEDCKHIFTYQSLDYWMSQKEVGNAIKMKECPKCKTTIWRSTRYGSIINALLTSLNEVKVKIWGDASGIKSDMKIQFENRWKNESVSDAFGFNFHETFAESQKDTLSESDVFLLETKMRRVDDLRRLTQECANPALTYYRLKKDLPFNLRYDVECVHWWICLKRTQATDQEESYFTREMKRIENAVLLVEIEKKIENPRMKRYIDTQITDSHKFKITVNRLRHLLLENTEPYHKDKEAEVLHLLEDVREIAPSIFTGLKISEEEKLMIRKAMNFATKGHWYSCPQGHVYAIGECGGATETSVCPECKEEIGGSSHRLLQSNRIATEMDGATRPAYDPESTYIPPEFE